MDGKINMNGRVRVELTTQGMKILESNGYAIGCSKDVHCPMRPIYKCSFWDLMRIFGPCLEIGNEPPFFSITMIDEVYRSEMIAEEQSIVWLYGDGERALE